MKQQMGLLKVAGLFLLFFGPTGTGCSEDVGGTGLPKPVTPDSVVLSRQSAFLVVGDTLRLAASATDSAHNPLSGFTFAWSSSDSTIATVSAEGLVTAKGSGTAVITATTSGRSGIARVTVLQPDSRGDAARGVAVWANECAQCHTSRQGWDLAHFGFADSTIIRRALGHVSLTSALDIVAHIHSLPRADTMTPLKRPFQPGGVVLSSDEEFGVRLFGSDQWPTTVTREQLLAQDPTTIPVALPLPLWADENSGYDWLPGNASTGQLPAGVLQAAQRSLDAYYANPNMATAMELVRKIRTLAHDPSIPDAPCTYESDVARYDPQKCADVGKWGATMLYIEGVRSGDLNGAGRAATGSWWETGHLFHKAQQFHRPLPERDLQIAGWIHLGWMWNRALGKNSLYSGGPLMRLKLGRHATWIILRTMVERRPGSVPLCADVESLAKFGAVEWMPNALAFAYRELEFRARSNELPQNLGFCAEMVRDAQSHVGRRLGSEARLALQPLADETLALVASSVGVARRTSAPGRTVTAPRAGAKGKNNVVRPRIPKRRGGEAAVTSTTISKSQL